MQGAPDAAGALVTTVYAKQPPYYAVYRTEERVAAQYADDEVTARSQRSAFARLNSSRGEINGLIDGWRLSHNPKHASAAKRYDRRVADALIIAFEGDVDNACDLLTKIKGDIVDERTSWARFQYLTVACAASAIAILIISLLGSDWFSAHIVSIPSVAKSLLVSAAAGTIGAFFSIAIALRTRTILTDIHFRDNAADAALRVIIGLIAASVLICLTKTKVATVFVGDPTTTDYSILYGLMIGFLAGFSERLIPDLLAKTTVETSPPRGSAQIGAGATGGKGQATTAHPTETTSTVSIPTSAADSIDGCICDHAVQPGEETPDTELPPTAGGVAVAH
jgi:hypothetical protein